MTNKLANHNFTNGPFEESWWLDIVAQGAWGESVIKKEINGTETVIARLPYVISGNKITLPNYTQTLGIWLSDEIKKPQRGNDHFNTQKEIIHELLKQLPVKKNVDIVLDCAQQYILPFRWEGFSIEPMFSYRITDLTSIENIESRFSKSIKRDINRGKKILHLDDSITSIQEFIELQNLTYKRQSRKNPVDNSFTAAIILKTIESGHGKLFMARDDDGKAHAGCFVLFDDRVCYHLLSGQDTSYGNDCAMPFLLYNEILFAMQVSEVFDFEGSMVEGIEQVYRRYGGEQVTTWRVTKQPLLYECIHILKPRIKKLIGYKI